MAPKQATKKKIITEEPLIFHDYSIFFRDTTIPAVLEILEVFKRYGWKDFLDYEPQKYMDEQVLQYYHTIHHGLQRNTLIVDVMLEIQGEWRTT